MIRNYDTIFTNKLHSGKVAAPTAAAVHTPPEEEASTVGTEAEAPHRPHVTLALDAEGGEGVAVREKSEGVRAYIF